MPISLWAIPLLPLAGSVALVVLRGWLKRAAVSLIGVGSVAASAAAAIAVALAFVAPADGPNAFTSDLGTWIAVGGLDFRFALRLDALALVMTLVITVVGFLIHLYSTVYMADDDGYTRFFAYMNLFMAAMLVLVLADNLLLLYLGWEGVGLCSYLLIGFWYRDAENGYAARKAFVVTRIGDTAMLIGLLLIAAALGTLDIPEVAARATAEWPQGSALAVAAAALLLVGALGKSAQLPLQTWLPDAMAGPTPVSALIHAATMVTAGMYLLARMHELFALAPAVQAAVAVLGAATLLLGAGAALAQNDVKRVLAYSTMSQIGYMFLALGVGAASAAVFHFFTHAFFKALLFLAAGVLILALHHKQDMRNMGGLRTRLPFVFGTFVVGAAALAAVPLVTAGFYSKEQILAAAWAAERGGAWLWTAGAAAALVTSIYIFRAVFMIFFGAPRAAASQPVHEPRGAAVLVPLGVLALLSIVAGFVETPAGLGHVTAFSDFLASVLPSSEHAGSLALEAAAAGASLAGIAIAYVLYFPRRGAVRAEKAAPYVPASGFLFDRIYDAGIVRPFTMLARALRHELLDALYRGVAYTLRAASRATVATQTGELRWYAAGMLAGAVVVVAIAVLA